MWFCSKCRNEMDDKYGHCWQCGSKRTVGRKPRSAAGVKAVPQFASYEEMAKVPARQPFLFRRGPITRLFWFVLIIGLFKFLSSQFLGKYGTYIVITVGVLGLVVILWRSFHRDPTEGVGVKLN
jgi:hypothetical protein